MQGGYVTENLSALMEPMAIQPVTQVASIVQELGPQQVGKNIRLQWLQSTNINHKFQDNYVKQGIKILLMIQAKNNLLPKIKKLIYKIIKWG